MNIETLNCPNCGASVSSDKTRCRFCRSRLKTVGCPSCLGLMFVGAKFCAHCGKRVTETLIPAGKNAGRCPRCRIDLLPLQIGETTLRECERCEGFWADVETFEEICADHEKQAAVLLSIEQHTHRPPPPKIQYVPCPECKNLMNRSNFARSSGVIIDTCKKHGVWFDAEELPKIIEFIRRGGIDRQREKEKLRLAEQRKDLAEQERKIARREARFNQSYDRDSTPTAAAIREFIRFLFD